MNQDISEFLEDKFKEMFKGESYNEFLEASLQKRPTVIRVNTLKILRKDLKKILARRGIEVEDIKWNKVGLTILNSKVPIGATPEYLAGYYFIQGASSMIPVECLELTSKHIALDVCSAPGGKTTHMAALMSNMGVLMANDISENRINSLVYNLNRMGIKNTVVTCLNGKMIDIAKFQRILLDAPCSGTGVISKEIDARQLDSAKLISLNVHQKQLILKSFDNLRNGGILVYSTCSVLPDENECIVNYLLDERPNAKLEKIDIEVGEPGFKTYRGLFDNKSLEKCKRIFPNKSNMDGFFVAKIRKC